MLSNLKVVIIGAGVSGLAAAGRLVEKGVLSKNIIILEALDRIGGRVHTFSYENGTVELGAQWIHGEKDNVVFDLASAAREIVRPQCFLGLATHDRVDTVSSNGEILTKKQMDEFQKIMEFIDVTACKEFKEWKGSFGEYFEQKYKEKVENGELQTMSKETAWALFDWYHRFQNTIDGSDSWFDTCGSGHNEYFVCEGDPTINWKRGYSALFDLLLKNVPKEKSGLELPLSSRIILNKPVKRVILENGKLAAECEDGSSFRADCVLVTCSLGFLRENPRFFVPALPERKIAAIQDLGFGTVNKLFLRFENPWWPEDWDGINFLRSPLDGAEWQSELLGFYVVRNQPNLLMSWLTGNAARTVEKLPDSVVMETCSRTLKKYLGGRFEYKEPSAYFGSKWHSNRFFRGSYSFRSNRSRQSDVWARHLAEPVVDDCGISRIFFAGEATSDHFYSTVHGAVESGWREAEKISAQFANIDIGQKSQNKFIASRL